MRTPITSKVKRANVPIDEKWYWVAWFTWELFNKHYAVTDANARFDDALRTGRPVPYPLSRFATITFPPTPELLKSVLPRCLWHLHEDDAQDRIETALTSVALWLDAYMLRNLPLRRKLIKEYFGDW